MTFASQVSPPVPLMPFFHVEGLQMPPELAQVPDTAYDDTGIFKRPDLPGDDPVRDAFAPGSDAELPEVEGEALAPSSGGGPNPDEMQLLSLAGGSFAAALTPPPSGPVPDGGEAAMGALGPSPWDPEPPKNGEQWSVNGEPPPAQGAPPPPLQAPPKLKLPPPVPKKGSVDEIALALGLPQLDDRPPPAPPPALLVSQPAEDEPLPKRSAKALVLIGASVLLVSAGIAFFVLRSATKELESPIETLQPPVLAASQPETAKPAKPDEATKRAQAIELYNKGNKLYLAKKFKEAEAEYRKALDADATFALAYRGLGVTYASQEKNQKAIESYKSYLKLAPDAKDGKLVRQIIKEAEQQK